MITFDEDVMISIAYRQLGSLLQAAGKTLDEDEYDEVKQNVADVCREL
jgi:hypothetical protein